MPASLRDRLHAPLAAVLALVALAVALLGYWAWQASVRHHTVAVALVRSQGQLAAHRFSARIVDELYLASTAAFRPVAGGRFGEAGRGAPLADPQAIIDAMPALERCRCVPVLEPAFAFRIDLGGGATRVVGKDTLGGADVARLVAAVRTHLPRLYGGWDVALLPADEAPGDRVVLVTHGGPPGTVVYGIGVDTAVLRSAVFRPILREGSLLPSLRAPPGSAPNDSLFALRIVDRSGRRLFGTRRAPDSAHAASFALGAEWGGLAVEASALEPVARAVLAGGLPRSPVPMMAALLLVAAALLAAAVVVLRRVLSLARLRSDFTSSVSHELRTPLAQILLYAEGLEMGHHRSRAERSRALAVITRETRRLMHLVENVLHFSRAERQMVRVDPSPQPLAPIAAEVIESFAPIAEARPASLVLRADDAHAAHALSARADGAAYRRMLLNLLDNAVRYGPAGQTVTVSVARDGAWTRTAVEDEGPGVPAADRERVWRPFVRLERDGGEQSSGGGIGLAIVRELAVQQGGRTRVEDAPGGGARFVIELPAADAGAPSDPESDAARADAAAGVAS